MSLIFPNIDGVELHKCQMSLNASMKWELYIIINSIHHLHMIVVPQGSLCVAGLH